MSIAMNYFGKFADQFDEQFFVERGRGGRQKYLLNTAASRPSARSLAELAERAKNQCLEPDSAIWHLDLQNQQVRLNRAARALGSPRAGKLVLCLRARRAA